MRNLSPLGAHGRGGNRSEETALLNYNSPWLEACPFHEVKGTWSLAGGGQSTTNPWLKKAGDRERESTMRTCLFDNELFT